jgi:membrane protein
MADGLGPALGELFHTRPWIWLRRLGRFLRLLALRFLQDGGLYHTSSLTYTTLLSLVPLMTVSLALFSAFPVSDRLSTEIQDFVFQNFVPASGEVVRAHLEQFSQKASRLTGAGSLFLVVVAVLMMANIDRAFNTIWQVRRKRSPLSMFVVYWAILTLGPIFMGISVALTSYLVSMPLLADAAASLGLKRAGLLGVTPVLASAAAFTLLYLVVPNRSVPFRHALAGGVLAAILFEIAKQGFALYVTTFPTYEAIYGALAAVPVFLIWIYLSWLVTLLGAEFTYCLGIYRDVRRPGHAGAGEDLLLAYRLLGYLWDGQRAGRALAMGRLISRERGFSETDLDRMLLRLAKSRLVLRTERGEWALARDLSRVSLLELCLAGQFPLPPLNSTEECLRESPELTPALQALRTEMEKVLDRPLADLFAQRQERPPPARP